jgi:hypothetical protein
MLDMILKYQRPRITYYLNKLRKALRFEEPTTCTTQDRRPRLSDEWLQKLPVLHTRNWIDDNENEFQFSGASLDEDENISRAALSAQSLKNINDEVDSIFKLVDQVSSLDENEDGHLGRAILKQLLPSLFSVWRSPRFQASIKARLRARFQDSQNSEKRQNEAVTALKFLCRVYYSVDTFIQAAESMPIFKSVECIPIPLQPTISTKATPNPFENQQHHWKLPRAWGSIYVVLAGFTILRIKPSKTASAGFEEKNAMFTPKFSYCPIKLNSLSPGMKMDVYIPTLVVASFVAYSVGCCSELMALTMSGEPTKPLCTGGKYQQSF